MPAKPNPERENRIRELHSKGLNDAVIAHRLGLTTKGVQKIRCRLGLTEPRS